MISIQYPVTGTSSRPAAVYRLFNCEGTLLYVGSAYDPWGRWLQHAKSSYWWPEVDQSRNWIEWYPSKRLADVAEIVAIRLDKPRCNERHALPDFDWSPKVAASAPVASFTCAKQSERRPAAGRTSDKTVSARVTGSEYSAAVAGIEADGWNVPLVIRALLRAMGDAGARTELLTLLAPYRPTPGVRGRPRKRTD